MPMKGGFGDWAEGVASTMLRAFPMKIPWTEKLAVALLALVLFFVASNSAEPTAPLLDANSQQQQPITLEPQLLARIQPKCGQLSPRVFENKVPVGRKENVNRKTDAASMDECVEACCNDDACSAAFAFINNTKLTCFKVSCAKDDSCLPSDPASVSTLQSGITQLVLVRPKEHATWTEAAPNLDLPVLEVSLPSTSSSSVHVEVSTASSSTAAASSSPSAPTPTPVQPSPQAAEERIKGKVVCEVGLDAEACLQGEVCVPAGNKSRNGICTKVTAPPTTTTTTTTAKPVSKKITVQVVSKEVQLPANSAELNAFAVPEALEESPYSYEWKLVLVVGQQTADSQQQQLTVPQQLTGSMENSHTSKLTLTGLVEGVYQFKVTVTGTNPLAFGEAFANVTVLPVKRVNQPPRAVIQPASQQINLPTSKAIVDASASSDDVTKDLLFKWELASNPVQYQHPLKGDAGATLTIEDLVEGSYVVRVTVTDADGASDSAEATIAVQPEKDYPPTANAGEDIIMYLPTNFAVLHGNQSSDDHGIVSWEWTRKATASVSGEVKDLAADIQDTRTPHARISNLEEGTYTFVLKVADAKGQSSQDEVNVYVKAPINQPPVANAGKAQKISLPRTWIALDGSLSKDDVNITTYLWEQLSGPNTANIIKSNVAVTNVTGLTKGVYRFRLSVTDDLGNVNTDETGVTVNQDENAAPVARAGEDFSATLPLPGSVVRLNGSASSDDFRIVRWLWMREAKSLAAGSVIGGSNNEPVLLLTDLVPGQYAFTLQVWDDQGKSSSDSVAFTVKESPDRLNVIEAVFNEGISSFTFSQMDSVCQAISLLLHASGNYKVKVLDVSPQKDTLMHFMMLKTDLNGVSSGAGVASVGSEMNVVVHEAVAAGKHMVDELRERLRADPDLLPVRLLELDTVVCQNNCSGHGTCHQATRACLCEPFWVENFVRRHLMDGKSNCEWSVIYLGVTLAVIALAVFGAFCYFFCRGRRLRKPAIGAAPGPTRRARRQKYSRLDQADTGMEMRSPYTSSLMISETDSDEEVLFENSGAPRLANGGHVSKRNGYSLTGAESSSSPATTNA